MAAMDIKDREINDEDTEVNKLDREAEPPDVINHMLVVLSALGCFMEKTNSFGLAMRDDPKGHASSTHTEHDEEVMVNKEEEEIHKISAIPDMKDDLMELGIEIFGGDVNVISVDLGPGVDGTGKKLSLQNNTAPYTVEEERDIESNPLRIVNEAWTELDYSSLDETGGNSTDTKVKTLRNGLVSHPEPSWEYLPYNNVTWADVEFSVALAEHIANRVSMNLACKMVIEELKHINNIEEKISRL